MEKNGEDELNLARMSVRMFALERSLKVLLAEVDALHDGLLSERKRNANLMQKLRNLKEEQEDEQEDTQEEPPITHISYKIGQPIKTQ